MILERILVPCRGGSSTTPVWRTGAASRSGYAGSELPKTGLRRADHRPPWGAACCTQPSTWTGWLWVCPACAGLYGTLTSPTAAADEPVRVQVCRVRQTGGRGHRVSRGGAATTSTRPPHCVTAVAMCLSAVARSGRPDSAEAAWPSSAPSTRSTASPSCRLGATAS